MRRTLLPLSLAITFVVFAAAGGEIPLDTLYRSLANAPSAAVAGPLESQILMRLRHSGSASVDLMLTRATLAGSSGDRATALRLATAINQLAPGFAEGWRLQAHLQELGGNTAGAIAALRRAVAADPRHFAAIRDLARLLYRSGDKNNAADWFARARALDPKGDGDQD